jgi:glutamate dehydrogenase/leucine dehydrogenase
VLHQRRLGIDLDLSRRKGSNMKIVVIGGTGLIGSKTVAILRQDGHKVVAASPQSGINTITGEGLLRTAAYWSPYGSRTVGARDTYRRERRSRNGGTELWPLTFHSVTR